MAKASDADPPPLTELRALLAKTVSLNRELTERLVDRHHMLSEADQAKTSFLASVSHEIRTPLHAIIGLANMLADSELDREQAHFVQLIRDSGDHLLGLINDILDISKIAAGGLEVAPATMDVQRVVDEAVAMVRDRAHERDLELIVEFAPDLPAAVVSDADRLRQVLINLIGNAIKFTDEGHVRAFVCRSGDTLRFIVDDTGPGIPANRLEKIFDPFVQLGNHEGAGLGLSICRDVARALGGDIHATSQKGQGSRFTCSIPIVEGHAANTVLGRFEDRRIHVLDDHPIQARCIANAVSQWTNNVTHGMDVPDEAELLLVDQDLLDGLDDDRPRIVLQCGDPVGPDVIAVPKPPSQRELHGAIGRALLQTEAPAREPRFDPDFASRHPLRILVAEDNPVNQIVAKGILKRFGYTCDMADDGKQAVVKAGAETYDLILMDLQMPEMDGIQATFTIQETVEPVPYIAAMTAHANKEDRDRCLRRGMDAYLSKPVRIRELKQVLRAAAQRRSAPKAVKSDP